MDVFDRLRFPWRGDEPREPFLDRAAHWASGLSYRDVPPPVRRIARTQFVNCVGAACWTRAHPFGDRVREALSAGSEDGSVGSIVGSRTAPEEAAVGNATLSSALRFDGAVLGGPIGHSSVFVPLAYAEATDSDGRRLLVAQVAANEIAGRIGAAATGGPFDEELATSVHAVGAAVGRSVVEGDDPETLANALGTALSQPPRPLERAVVGSDAGVWGVGSGIRSGTVAVDSARSGIDGPREPVRGPGGFLCAATPHPSPGYLSGLGERWHTRTLSVKQFPGSFFVAGPIEAALEARGRFDRGRTTIGRVEVFVPQATITAATRAESHAGDSESLSSRGYDVSHGVATALVEGERTPAQFGRERSDGVRRIEDRLTLRHDPELTLAAARSTGQTSVRLGAGPLGPIRAARTLGAKLTVRHLPTVFRSGRERTPPSAMERAERRFGARVVVTTADGRTVESTVERPAGFAGGPHEEIGAIARRKLRRGLEAFDVDGATARRRVEDLSTIDRGDSVSLDGILNAVDGE